MPLIRGHHAFDDHFTQIPNDWVRDNRLSLKARGLLTMLMSHRVGWSLSINSIAKECQEGKDAIRTAIAELEKFNYLERSQVNESGRYGEAIWTTKDPEDSPLSEKPLADNPTPKNTIYKEEHVKNTISELEIQFNEFWNEYPRKIDRAAAIRAFKSALKRAKFEELLAGAIAYRNDPTRKPEYTKYPATWLNADSWENAATLPEVKAASEARRAKEKAQSDAYLREMEEIAKQAVPLTPELRKKLGL
jgi:hypothetical protein